MAFLEPYAVLISLLGSVCTIAGVIMAFRKGKAALRTQAERPNQPGLGLAEILIVIGLVLFGLTVYLAFFGMAATSAP